VRHFEEEFGIEADSMFRLTHVASVADATLLQLSQQEW
jgi:hypothetical protein